MIKPFETFTGLVVPLDRANVDTDQIIPKQYLKSIKRTGFGVNLFDDLRYLDPGEPGQDHSQRRLNPDFVLNQPRYQGAEILLAGENFGVAPPGSTRRGRWGTTASAWSSHRASPTFSTATASKTDCCPSCWTRTQ